MIHSMKAADIMQCTLVVTKSPEQAANFVISDTLLEAGVMCFLHTAVGTMKRVE